MYRIKPAHITGIKVITHGICLGFIALFYYWGFTDQLEGDPVKILIHQMGIAALNMLLLTLALSPIAKTFRQSALIKLRRLFGLYSFAFAALHFTNYLVFDLQLDWANLFEDIIKRPYMTVGFVSIIILFALSITSPDNVKRKMKKHWQTLHNFVYLSGALGVLHYIWSVKTSVGKPLVYLIIITILLVLRKDKAKHWIKKQFKA
ncbi:protein-methionine-sulfoxide reductase heme-binding subunit MsrQ [Alteromonas sp. a30]|uniref:protein-methionine-sulfoxide reductase heme-binding subunit MsrQ n=1 Tax=Alteromonas sp. a30 TaxID=2730917 RepID=UPI00228110C4|nr:protein-methionine-sulfoxide reductase heme-binding subunit MsrQ [Alteromonas sp. a30]MCY7294138.1 sulfoxide reductase heme-binding subunit YedZ [Alteromonas sp. a30]